MRRIKRAKLFVFLRQHRHDLFDEAFQAVPVLASAQSLKAALDCDWDDPTARTVALEQVLVALTNVEAWLDAQPVRSAAAHAAMAVAEQVRQQDVEVLPDNVVQLRRGVAKERRISVEDGEMRHGRKSPSHLIDGFKRHILRDLDTDLVRVVGLTAANVPEATVTDEMLPDLERQHDQLGEIHIDRAYLASTLVRNRPPDLQIYCKAWPVRNGNRSAKTAFTLDWEAGTISCPHQIQIPFRPGMTVHFPEEECQTCPLRERCTASVHGRSVRVPSGCHPDERVL